jgi:hypothetical protein
MQALTALTKQDLKKPDNSSTENPTDPSKKPQPLWLKFSFGVTLILLSGSMIFVLSEPISRPKNISVSNVSSGSITLSWTTVSPDETKVTLSEANYSQYLPLFFYAAQYDDRDRGEGFRAKRNTHYVTLKNLKPGERYIAKIYSGMREVHTQRLTTGPLINLPSPNLVYGKILNPQNNPAPDTLVYLRLNSSESSTSALLSAVTDSKGFWSIETSNARTRSLTQSFNAREVGYEVLVVDQGNGQRFKATTRPGADKPWPNIILTASKSAEVKK